MREIKFRVWDKLAEKFIYPDKGYQGHFILDLNGRFHNLQNGSGGDEYIVQQYTGLKDTIKVEVFEGDILQYVPDYIESKAGQCETEIFDVKFEDGCFVCDGQATSQSDMSYYNIIGNIFENPELLE